jgi:hypothetical protein
MLVIDGKSHTAMNPNPAEKIVLGHMPLIGVSYQSPEIDEKYRTWFSEKKNINKIIHSALDLGITRFAASSPGMSPLANQHLEVLRGYIQKGHDIEVIPCFSIPVNINGKTPDAFRRWATYIESQKEDYPGILNRFLSDPILGLRPGWKEKLPEAKPYTGEELENLKIDWEKVEKKIGFLKDLPAVYLEQGSETDFLTMAGRFDLLGELIDRIREQGFNGVICGVHHAGKTIPKLDEELPEIEGYVTPINSKGYMMLPVKEAAEEAIRGSAKKIFAIKPLAGGRINPEEAFQYVYSFRLESCMFGAAKVEEVKADYREAVKACMTGYSEKAVRI